MERTFSIAEIAEKTGLSYDTLRYYEKIGLLPPVKRKKNGQREYDKRDLDRFIFVLRLKRTSMPLKGIERYLTFATEHDYESCYNLLQEHKVKIESMMTEMNATLEILDYKLDNFKELMNRSELEGD